MRSVATIPTKHSAAKLEICAPKCDGDSDCPTDTCPGATSKPRCFMQDQTGQKYRGLPCKPDSIKCGWDRKLICQDEGQGAGICAYIDV